MAKIIPGFKDENGIYVPQPRKAEEPALPKEDKHADPADISIDALMGRGLKSLYAIIRSIEAESQHPSRETVQNLKDVMSMLKDLKKDEKEFLDSLSDEELSKLSKK